MRNLCEILGFYQDDQGLEGPEEGAMMSSISISAPSAWMTVLKY